MFGFPVPYLPEAQQKGVRFHPVSKMTASFFPLEPYTCGACGIQFQFYNNLLEHMQSHAGKGPNGPPGMLQPSPFPFLRPCKRQRRQSQPETLQRRPFFPRKWSQDMGPALREPQSISYIMGWGGLCSGETACSVGAQRVGIELKKAS